MYDGGLAVYLLTTESFFQPGLAPPVMIEAIALHGNACQFINGSNGSIDSRLRCHRAKEAAVSHDCDGIAVERSKWVGKRISTRTEMGMKVIE